MRLVAIRAGLKLPKIEVRFKDLSVEADPFVGGRAFSTLLNATLNIIEVILQEFHLNSDKRLSFVDGFFFFLGFFYISP